MWRRDNVDDLSASLRSSEVFWQSRSYSRNQLRTLVFLNVRCQHGKIMLQATVLIVEDEPIIRLSVAEDFQSAGLHVLEASNADDALAILEAGWPVKALFSDVEMHGSMDGLELARLVRERWPQLHIILTSGLKHPNGDELPHNTHFFPKPYLHQTVIGALCNLLEDDKVFPGGLVKALAPETVN